MVMGIVAVAVVGFVSVFTVIRRKNEGGSQDVRLGRLY